MTKILETEGLLKISDRGTDRSSFTVLILPSLFSHDISNHCVRWITPPNIRGGLLYSSVAESIFFCGNGGRRVGAGQNKAHCPSFKLILRQQNTYKSAWIKKQSAGSYGTSDLFKWSVGVLRVSAQPIKLRKHSHQMAAGALSDQCLAIWLPFFFFFLAPFVVGPGL